MDAPRPVGSPEFESWGPERIDDLTGMVLRSMPEEDLTADELFTACFDRPGPVIGDHRGVIAVGLGHDPDGATIAAVRLLVVEPDHRRTGVASALLEQAEQWAVAQGAVRIELGGATPFALWPAVDPSSPLTELAAVRGYRAEEHLVAHGVPNGFRAPAPQGVDVRRAVRDPDVLAVTLAVASSWPDRSDEVARALEHGTCHVAIDESSDGAESVLGIGCHSVTRATWVGPFVVRADQRRRGIGHALLGQICRDLMIAEFPIAEVPDVAEGHAPVEAFLLAAGAVPVRRSRRLVLDLDL